ncbi:MAG: hypothetical protein WC881_04980, partial [Elusimicrobiota bacterium]
MIAILLAYTLAVAASAQTAPGSEPLQSLTVALYHGEPTRESVRFLSDYYRNEAPYQVRDSVDNAGRFMSEAGSAVTRPFGGSVSVERPEEAARAGADLVAVLEAEAAFKRNIKLEKYARVRLAVEFRDLAGKRIANLEAESIKAPIAEGRVRIRQDLYREFAQALDAAAALLEGQVRKSPELAAYAAQYSKSRPATQPALDAAVSSESDRAAYRLPVEASALALVVGVERYEDGSQAAYAERDAAAIRAQLIGLGWPDRNVFWLAGRRADRAAVRAALQACSRRGAGAAKAFFYFAGLTGTDPKGGSELRL